MRYIIALGVIIDCIFVGMQNIKIVADKTIIGFMFHCFALKKTWKSSVCLNCSDYVVSCSIYMLAVELNQAEGSC